MLINMEHFSIQRPYDKKTNNKVVHDNNKDMYKCHVRNGFNVELYVNVE